MKTENSIRSCYGKDVARLEERKDHLAELRKENTQGAAELAYLRDRQIYDIDVVMESACMQEAFASLVLSPNGRHGSHHWEAALARNHR